MSEDTLLKRRDLLVSRQPRCSYTGGAVSCSQRGSRWLLCLNNGDLTFLSLQTGEILFNVSSAGAVVQRAAVVRGEDDDRIVA